MRKLLRSCALVTGFALVGGLGCASSAGASDLQAAVRGLAPKSVAQEACPRIVGGSCTTQAEWPWQTALYFQDGAGRKLFTCGGSLIAPNWILTAAHCFGEETSDRAEDWTVVNDVKKLTYVGLPEGATTRAVKTVIRHEGYNPRTQENDIALLELAAPLSAQTIVPLGAPDSALEADRETVVTGWGATIWLEAQKDQQGHITGFVDGVSKQPIDPRASETPDLREATLPLVDVAECKGAYAALGGSIDQRNLCAALPEGGRDSCQGDSGGPMMAKTDANEWRQVGVVSWGRGCGVKGFPGIYTRVSAFADWMKAKMDVAHEAAPTPAPAPAPSPAPATDVPDNPAGLTIAFDKGDDVAVGDLVEYVATANQPGYLAIFDAGPDGQLTQIYPNSLSLRSPTGAIDSSRLDPKRPVIVPNYKNPYAGFYVNIAEPRGAGVIVAVLSQQPLKSLETPKGPKSYNASQGLELVGRLRKELVRSMQVEPKGAEHPPWSIALRKYTVR